MLLPRLRKELGLQILFEGQEEIGSPNLANFLKKHKKLLRADFAISADGGQDSPTQGIIALGLRGASAFEVEIKTLERDGHSGGAQLLSQHMHASYALRPSTYI